MSTKGSEDIIRKYHAKEQKEHNVELAEIVDSPQETEMEGI